MPLDPKLGPLGDYGGPTQTCLPCADSPAVDAGSNPANLLTDERGNPRVQGPADIGAVERTPGLPDANVGSLPTVTTAGGTSYQFTVTYTDATAIDASTFGGGDVLVTGPGGFSHWPSRSAAIPEPGRAEARRMRSRRRPESW